MHNPAKTEPITEQAQIRFVLRTASKSHLWETIKKKIQSLSSRGTCYPHCDFQMLLLSSTWNLKSQVSAKWEGCPKSTRVGSQAGNGRAGRETCCSEISSASCLTSQPWGLRIKSTSVLGPSLAMLQSVRLMAIQYLCTPWSFIALERLFSAFPSPVPGKQLKMKVQQETENKSSMLISFDSSLMALWQTGVCWSFQHS